MSQAKTNVDLVTDITEHSSYGGLIQAFVISALEAYAKAVIADPPQTNGFISAEAWLGCAQEVKAKMDAFYSRFESSNDDEENEDENE